jgi:limonene-1,2-epoxide hydrolase
MESVVAASKAGGEAGERRSLYAVRGWSGRTVLSSQTQVACWGMTSRAVVTAFWAAMQANDWDGAAFWLAADCVIDWPCSGERIVGRSDFAAVQARYPTRTGWWTFEIHRLLIEDNTAVSEVTVTDGEQSARVVCFSEINGGHIVRQTEYWPTAYDPLPGREDLTRPTERIP